MIHPTRRQLLAAATAVAAMPMLSADAFHKRVASTNTPLVAMEYETWFTCAVGSAPSVAAVRSQSQNKLNAVQLAAGQSVRGITPLEQAILKDDVDGSCSTRPAAAWSGREATPLLGTYESSNPHVIEQHAEWITSAGVDFLLIDWSNNLGGNWSNGVGLGIMAATYSLAQTYLRLRRHPRFALLLGLDARVFGTQNWFDQVDMVYDLFIQSKELRPLYQDYLGKPLLGVFTGPRFTPPPDWSDPRFTVRWVNGFDETTHGNTMGYWSWIDRQPQVTYREESGPNGLRIIPEAVTVAAGWPGGGPSSQGGWSSNGARKHGQTLVEQWQVAFKARPEVVLLCQWNEFNQPDQYSVEMSNDMEPTQLHGYGLHGDGGWGTYYLDLTTTMVRAFKAGKPQPKVTLNAAMP